ncbi:PARP-type domain-containing protein (Fragment) [Durusdinium trenchii]|uniref:PARP-type domain-containing protein n=1 Tax=Durusdinium trenchii TaxID=1381693 RepID=A0ABP0MC69_9DINO
MRSIHSVTNTVQTLHVIYSDSSCECTMLPTPFISLPGQKTDDVYSAYSAHLIVSNGPIGHRIQALENAVPDIGAKLQDLLEQVGWKLHVFVGDAAKTNSAIFRIQKRRQLAAGTKRKLSIQVKCLLHQICLVRRPSILAIDSYWSTVVRLAHLFENWSFKRQFGISLLHILKQPGIAVSEFPDEMSNWKLRADWLVKGRKVVEQVSKAEFPQSVIMVDVIVNALEYGSNALFKRTSLLTRMSNLGSHHPEYTTLAKECMERFLDMASGSFGKRLVERTVLLLDDGLQEMIDLGGFSPTPERLVLFFRLIVSCMSDLWRRMIFEFSRYPWKWFDILAQDLSLKQFVEKFDQVQAQSTSHCCSCVDSEFSQVILAECLTSLSKEPMHEQYRIYNDVKQVLQQEKNLRVQTAAHRAVRSLSGWNIFQRENTQGVQMGTAEYKSHLQNLSAQWKSLSQDDKAAWNIQARHEQMCREELVGTPLPAKGEGMSELDLAVGRKGRSKLSGKRLQLNTELYNQHFLWSTPTQLGDGDGALKAELIDVKSPDDQVSAFLRDTIHAVYQDVAGDNSENTEDLADSSLDCFPGGLCRSGCHFDKANQFVYRLHKELDERKIKSGSLLTLTLTDHHHTHVFFSGITLKKPLLQTAILASIQDDVVSFQQDPNSSIPCITTTHHMFLQMLETGSTATSVHVEHWLYKPIIDDTKALRVNADHILTSFTVDIASSKSVSRKRPIKLPFGLKEIRKPRKRKTEAGAGAKHQAKRRRIQDPTDDLPCECDSDSGSDSNSSSGNPSDIDGSGEVAPLFEEDNEVEPISEIMENEMKAEWQVAEEIQEADKNKARLAKYTQGEGTAATAESKNKTKTFFSQRLGLGCGSIAPTGRAKCYHCKVLIGRDTIRFEWYWNKLRPNGWLHNHCLIETAQKFELLDETMRQLDELTSASSSSDNTVREESARILASMRRKTS